jgi:hypothetical protein
MTHFARWVSDAVAAVSGIWPLRLVRSLLCEPTIEDMLAAADKRMSRIVRRRGVVVDLAAERLKRQRVIPTRS